MDSLYSVDEDKLTVVRQQMQWMNDPKYFKKVKISPSASIKMMMHSQQGVNKGIKLGGKPIEVMGLLLGRPDTEDRSSLVITDAQALPIEGFETKVVADDENVINYMIELGDSFELSRKERFCGWYHTHPFDLGSNGHCFLSHTDVTTQLQWQRSEDGHGNPWLAIVIDPIYSIAKQRPEMMAFRVYPPDHNGAPNEVPDGATVLDDRRRLELWGSCWNRYYKLNIEFFMSDLTQKTLSIVRNKFLWHAPLVETITLDEGLYIQCMLLHVAIDLIERNYTVTCLDYHRKTSSDVKKVIRHLELSKPSRRSSPNPFPSATTAITTSELAFETIGSEEEPPTKQFPEEREGGKLVHGPQVQIYTTISYYLLVHTSTIL
jgi:COP9 signalosome complex subunit 5